METTRSTLKAMSDLRSGKITADDYRAIMREQRNTTSEQDRNAGMLKAFAMDYSANR